MPQVTLDIAGFFFDKTVKIPKGSTVKDLMQAVKDANDPNDNKTAIFDFREGIGQESGFIDEISILHRGNSAKSRQKGGRVYPDGLYSYADDPVEKKKKRLSPEGKDSGIVLAWQYYVYSKKSVDKNREGSGIKREIVPFSDSKKDYPLEDGDTVVWRLIALSLGPTKGLSLKGMVATS